MQIDSCHFPLEIFHQLPKPAGKTQASLQVTWNDPCSDPSLSLQLLSYLFLSPGKISCLKMKQTYQNLKQDKGEER